MERLEYIAEIAKPPTEQRPFTIDYTDKLPIGASVSSGTVAAYNHFTGALDNTVIGSTTGTKSGDTISATLRQGTAGQKYDIIFTTTLSDASILVDYLLLSVQIPRAMR